MLVLITPYLLGLVLGFATSKALGRLAFFVLTVILGATLSLGLIFVLSRISAAPAIISSYLFVMEGIVPSIANAGLSQAISLLSMISLFAIGAILTYSPSMKIRFALARRMQTNRAFKDHNTSGTIRTTQSEGIPSGKPVEAQTQRSGGATFVRLLSYLNPHWLLTVAVASTDLLATALDLVQPWIIGFLLVGEVITQRNLALLPWVALLLAVAYVAKQVADYFQGYYSESLSQKLVHRLRYDVYHHLEQLPVKFFDDTHSGEMVSRIISDTDVVEGVIVNGLSNIGTDLMSVIGTFILLFYISPRLALIVTPMMAALILMVNLFKKRIKRSSRKIREAVGELAAKSNETIVGIRTVKSFSMEEHEAKVFRKRSQEILDANVKLAKLSGLNSAAVELLTGSAVILVILVASPSVVFGSLSLGALIAFLGYLAKLFSPIMDLSKINISFQKAIAAGERLFQVVDSQPENAKEVGGDAAMEPPALLKGRVEFQNVSFCYDPSKMVLTDFNLMVEPGETVAIVGRSGAGKSTMISLLLRFYEPTSGRILIDGLPIRSLNLKSLRQRIGLVLQEPLLFSGSVAENIGYGNLNAGPGEIVAAAKASNADEFIRALPDGYDTQIGERGVKLSGGQRQRIAIARALLKNPSILILDEATSNVDSESEALIQDALKTLTRGRTTFIIGHRLSAIMNADKIVVLEDGEIQEIGTHKELMLRSGRYVKLYDAQM